MMDLLRYTDTYPAEAASMDAAVPLSVDGSWETGLHDLPDPLDWDGTRVRFSLLRDEVRAPVTAALEADGTDIANEAPESSAAAVRESGLTADERFIQDAYMMAKRAVRIAKEIGGDPKQLIGTGDELKAKAASYIPFVLANTKRGRISS